MAKSFMTLEEAVAKLGCSEEALKQAVRDGKLREFRDAGTVNYKVDEISKLAASGELSGGSDSGASGADAGGSAAGADASSGVDVSSGSGSGIHLDDADLADLSGSMGTLGLEDSENPMPDLSASGSIGLADTGGLSLSGTAAGGSVSGQPAGGTGHGSDPSDSSGIRLSSTGDEDMVSFDDDEQAGGKGKDDTVVSSVGVSVFDEEDLSESADPLAKTAMGGTGGGTGLEGVGSGSGLLDLTRESDDTSLGAELLDEIYSGDETGGGTGTLEMGEATRAGLDQAVPPVPAEAGTDEQDALEAVETAAAVTEVEEAEPAAAAKSAGAVGDRFGSAAAALVPAAILIMLVTGLTAASGLQEVWPSILSFLYGKLWMYGVGAVVVSAMAMGLGVFLARRSGS